jgi:hypothetical protein
MTVTELLETVRRVELRTNRLLQSSSPGFQLLRITAGVEDGQNDDAFRLNQKMNHKGKPAENHRPADFAARFPITSRGRSNVGFSGPAAK